MFRGDIRQTELAAKLPQGVVLTIGNFDGVHKGHQALLNRLKEIARSHQGPTLVMTFDPHPSQLLSRGKGVPRLFGWQDQASQLEKLGIDYLVIQKFDQAFAETSSEDYLKDFLVKIFKPRAVLVGYDFQFGHRRQGKFTDLQAAGEKYSFHTEQFAPHFLDGDGQVASSTFVRKNLSQGKMEKVQLALGRPFYIDGEVIDGYKKGRQWGFPTMNFLPQLECSPPWGVYVSQVQIKGQTLPAISNWGVRPTVYSESKRPLLETHIFNFDQDLYGQKLRVELLHFLRPELKFEGIEELKRQIQRDMKKAQDFFAGAKR